MKYFVSLFVLLSFMAASCSNKPAHVSENADPLTRLKEGNKRFVSGKPLHPDESLQRIKNIKNKQTPFAVIVSCSDSRVPPELVFDQGLGMIFSVRTAGNVIGEYELGSIEYAVENLGCKTIIVLGHENCGAIHAYLHPDSKHKPDHINSILQYIAAEKEEQSIPQNWLQQHAELAVEANVLHGVHFLKSAKPVLNDLFNKKQINVMGAVYDMDSGKVEFLHDKQEKKYVKTIPTKS